MDVFTEIFVDLRKLFSWNNSNFGGITEISLVRKPRYRHLTSPGLLLEISHSPSISEATIVRNGIPAPFFKAPTPGPSLPLFKNLCFPSPLFCSTPFKVFQTVPPSSSSNTTHQPSLQIIKRFNQISEALFYQFNCRILPDPLFLEDLPKHHTLPPPNYEVFYNHRTTPVLELAPVLGSLFNKVACLMPANLFKKRLRNRCSLVNFVKFSRIAFLKNPSDQLFLTCDLQILGDWLLYRWSCFQTVFRTLSNICDEALCENT